MTKVDFTDSVDTLKAIGEHIMSYEPLQNAYLYSLINRIGRVIVTSRLWNNPYAIFKKGLLEMGETTEEIFVNIAKSYSYDPTVAPSTIYKRNIPDVRAAFHTMNFQKYYPITVQDDQLRQAFISFGEQAQLIAYITESLYTAMHLDEFVMFKYLIGRAICDGMLEPVTVTAIASDPDDCIQKFRQYTNDLTILSTKYNYAGVWNHTPVDEQIIMIPNSVEAVLGVDVLANAFNISQVDYISKRIAIDSFTMSTDQQGILRNIMIKNNEVSNRASFVDFTSAEKTLLASVIAIKVDPRWFMVYDNMPDKVTENYNGKGLYWNYNLHAWRTFSVSPFANALVFTTTSPTITSVTVSPSTANMTPGTSMKFSVAVVSSGVVDKSVTWSVATATSDDTKIMPDGTLTLGADEEAQTLTVTAKSVANTNKTGTATVTVVSS